MLGSLGSLRRHFGRTMPFTQTNTQKRRRRWIAVGIAVVGGLIAGGGYFWVAEAAAVASNPFESPQWDGISTGPGIAAFFAGSVILLSALVVLRRRVRPDSGSGLIWVSVWCAWPAIALTCLGAELNVDVDGSIGAALFWLGLLVGLLAAGMLILGISTFVAHVADQRSRR